MSWPYYSALRQSGNRLLLWLGLMALLGLPAAPALAADELLIESGPGQAGELSWAGLKLRYELIEGQRQFELELRRIQAQTEHALGNLRLRCSDAPVSAMDGCKQGEMHWQLEEHALSLKADLSWQRQAEYWQVEAHGEGWQLSGSVPQSTPQMASLALTLDSFDLALLPLQWIEGAGLSVLAGQLEGRLLLDAGQLQATLIMSQLGFDSPDGSLAADGLEVDLSLEAYPLQADREFSLELEQAKGEWLVGSIYLPPPESSLRLKLGGHWAENNGLILDQIELVDPEAMQVSGRAILLPGDEGWSVDELVLDRVQLELPLAWERWVEGPAASAGFGGLETGGMIEASLNWQADRRLQAEAELHGFSINDPAGRISMQQVRGTAGWGPDGPLLALDWQGLQLYGLAFAAASLALESGLEGTRLLRPLRMPLLDGAVVIDQLDWRPVDPDSSGFGFDARIEPLSLSDLTRQLELPVFGGQLSGAFPGVRYANDVLSFTGGIDVQAFSGRISLADLAVERPFGTLPALSAQVEFSRLDLLELTGAFNFGRMEGQLSGWARNLRLLNWRPVAMDARVFTHDDVRRRRISQRAVDNLSSLGGAGGALLTGTVLRLFDDFPYSRAGLACRLSNNICHIDGVARHESGGFYIVEGRSLPRLDIIGHRRLVDWPQLISQLEAAMEGN